MEDMVSTRHRDGNYGVLVASWMTPSQRDRLRDFAAEHDVTVADLIRRGSDMIMREIETKENTLNS